MAGITHYSELLPGDVSYAIRHLSQPSEDEARKLAR